MEPPPSVPTAIGPRPTATAATAPELLPPGVRAGSHGLRVRSPLRPRAWPPRPNSAVAVVPRMTAPCWRNRAAGRILGRWPVGRRPRSAPRWQACNRQQVLERYRDAIEQTGRGALAPTFGGGLCRTARALLIEVGEGSQAAIDRGDASQHRFDHRHRGQLAATIARGQGSGSDPMQRIRCQRNRGGCPLCAYAHAGRERRPCRARSGWRCGICRKFDANTTAMQIAQLFGTHHIRPDRHSAWALAPRSVTSEAALLVRHFLCAMTVGALARLMSGRPWADHT